MLERIWLPVIGLAFGLPAAAVEIGTVGAVNRDMEGTPPAAARRVLDLGATVVRDERIETSSRGSGQLIFVDQTSLSVAPGTDLVLDSYVYDPGTDRGEMSLSLTRGALRFIGGRISKSRDVQIKTPTSTIGIRGGLCIVRVNPAGQTQVIQIAGEYTTVTGSSGAPVTLSRSNATAVVGGDGAAKYTGLADQDTLADAYATFEGTGDGGTGSDAPEQSGQSGNQSGGGDSASQSGGETGDSDTASGKSSAQANKDAEKSEKAQGGTGAAARGSDRVAAVNSDAGDGASRQPISTSGEQDRGSAPSTGGGEDTTARSEAADTASADNAADDATVPATVISSPTFPLPNGGGIFTLAGGYGGFGTVSAGSLVATAGGQTLRIPIPASPTDFVATGSVSLAHTLDPNAGFFEFFGGDGGSFTPLGAIEGRGFADLDTAFFLVEFSGAPASPGGPSDGFAVFGTPTPGQASVFTGDDGTLPAGANTTDVYFVEPDFEDIGAAGPGGSGGPASGVLMIANAGEGRIAHPSHSRPANGGRVLSGEVLVEIDPGFGGQVSALTILAAPLTSSGAGPQFSAQIFESFGGAALPGIARTNVGLFEDSGGETVFGPDGEYVVASPLHRPGGTGALIFDPGVEHFLGGPDLSQDGFANVLTRDPSRGQVVGDPLGLVREPTIRISPGSDGILDGVMATGFVHCSTGDCGIPLAGGGRAGLYLLTPAVGPNSGFIQFEFGQFSGADDNSVGATFMVTDGPFQEASILGGPPPTISPNFVFSAPFGPGESSAYLSDRVFGLVHSGPMTIDDQAAFGDIAVVSSDLAGDGGVLPGGVDASPRFLRWGWWSANFRPVDEGTALARDDILHLGNWVGGVRPNPSDIPFTGTATYSGLAVGTDANLQTGHTAVVGGEFSLAYDFGTSSGALDLNIAGHSFGGVPISGFGTGSPDYAGSTIDTGGASLDALGGFYAGAGDPVAATGGQFTITDLSAERQVSGIFAGDRD